MVFCPSCGADNWEGANFCKKCGKQMAQSLGAPPKAAMQGTAQMVPIAAAQPVMAQPAAAMTPVMPGERPTSMGMGVSANDLDGCWFSCGCCFGPPFPVAAVGCIRAYPARDGGPAWRKQTFVNLLMPILPVTVHFKPVPGTNTWHGYDDCFGEPGCRNCENQTVLNKNSITESGNFVGRYWRCG